MRFSQEALRKLQAAIERSVSVYAYGATGFGKTRLVEQALKIVRRYDLIGFGENCLVRPSDKSCSKNTSRQYGNKAHSDFNKNKSKGKNKNNKKKR